MQKVTSKWIELQCQKCEMKDRMPLSQYEEYKNYNCPYEAINHELCYGKMKVLIIRELEFAPNIQGRIF